MNSRVIDSGVDTDYYTDVRTLLGVTVDELGDDILSSDIILGAAERAVCGIHVPNWHSVLNGKDQIAEQALRSCVVIKAALNILNMPATQNLLIDQVRLPGDIVISAKKTSTRDLRRSLENFFEQQLALVGVEHTGDWPEKEIVGASDSVTTDDYYIDTSGNIQQS